MEHKRILIILSIVLAVACIAVTSVFVAVNRRNIYLSPDTLNDIVAILAESGVDIDSSIIPAKKRNDNVYFFGSDDYNSTVARLLSGDEIKSEYVIPDGEIIVMGGGSLFELHNDYSFRYSRDGEKHKLPNTNLFNDSDMHTQLYDRIKKTATEFLDSGSKNFNLAGKISVETHIEKIFENDGKYYAVCSRTIDGVEITGNTVVITYEDGIITGAEGTWCFLTEGKSYSAQLSDILNILFNVKKELHGTKDDRVRITSVGMCYSLYYYGGGEEFCLIPCWQIMTENDGNIVFNAIDSTLYTNNEDRK